MANSTQRSIEWLKGYRNNVCDIDPQRVTLKPTNTASRYPYPFNAVNAGVSLGL